MKKLFAAIPAVVLAIAALTGCTGSSPSDLTISGDFGGALTFESGFPVSDPGGKVEVVEQGDKPVTEGDTLLARRTVFNGETGEQLVAQAAVLPIELVDEDPEWLRKIVSTTGVNQRSVIIAELAEVYGEGVGEQVGMSDSAPLVIVDDVLAVVPNKANGTDQDLPAGFPTVKLAKNGQPTITLPEGDAPGELMIAATKVGDGATVAAGDDVVVQYQGTIWRTGEVFNQSWGSRIPASFNTEAVVPGFKSALVGQTVGSQVVVIIPPDQGYGSGGNSNAGIEGTDTLVFVVDILAVLPALPAAQ